MTNILRNALIFIVFSVLATSVSFADTASKDASGNANSDSGYLQKELNLPSDDQQTALSERTVAETQVEDNPYSLLLYKPTYILPFYYTQSPYQTDDTPLGQKIESEEFKGQLSFQAPIVYKAFGPKNSLNIAYTQLSYWQVYAASQYFRETDYEPEIFFLHTQNNYFSWKTGAEHQSNGRGGTDERSWNRLYGAVNLSGGNWLFTLEPWMLIFKNDSSDIHNPDIIHYMGDGEEDFSYKFSNKLTISVITRNNLESRFARGTEEIDFTFPLTTHFHGFVQFFSGYGQSLIEYNHYTNAVGVGFALNAPI